MINSTAFLYDRDENNQHFVAAYEERQNTPERGVEETAKRVSDSDRQFLGGETEHRRERNDGCFAPSCRGSVRQIRPPR
jgi:hypothetical protein